MKLNLILILYRLQMYYNIYSIQNVTKCSRWCNLIKNYFRGICKTLVRNYRFNFWHKNIFWEYNCARFSIQILK